MTEYRVWTIVEGGLEDDEVFTNEAQRDERAIITVKEIAEECNGMDYQIYTANVTVGCSVGEFAGEEAVCIADSSQ